MKDFATLITNRILSNDADSISLYRPRRIVSKNVEYYFMMVEEEVNRRLREGEP